MIAAEEVWIDKTQAPWQWRWGKAWSFLRKLNKTEPGAGRENQLKANLGSYGSMCCIRSPFVCEKGNRIFLGKNVFINANCMLMDVHNITIGDHTMLGPGVHIYTADHEQFGCPRETTQSPVTIGSNVLVGGGTIILPGITIGDNATVGAGSVVTKDVPANVRVAGNPARELP